MKILAIDPGPTESAYLVLIDGHIDRDRYGLQDNEALLARLKYGPSHWGADILVIEKIASFGMAVGEEVFETVFWTGRFVEAWSLEFHRLTRHQIKMHVCKNMKARDTNIRQSLIDRFGKPGTKKTPGHTYGITGHVWSAMAVAVTWEETQ